MSERITVQSHRHSTEPWEYHSSILQSTPTHELKMHDERRVDTAWKLRIIKVRKNAGDVHKQRQLVSATSQPYQRTTKTSMRIRQNTRLWHKRTPFAARKVRNNKLLLKFGRNGFRVLLSLAVLEKRLLCIWFLKSIFLQLNRSHLLPNCLNAFLKICGKRECHATVRISRATIWECLLQRCPKTNKGKKFTLTTGSQETSLDLSSN